MTLSPNLNLPYIQAAQAQKHITHNEALRALDVLVQLCVLSKTLVVAPAAPQNGDCYIVGLAPSGLWSGKSEQIAAWQDNGWFFYPPNIGWRAWVKAEEILVVWDGAAWSLAASGSGSGGTTGGTTGDTTGNNSVLMPNLVANSDFAINQRGFAGGVLTGGAYGHDRWKAGATGADYSIGSGTGAVTLSSGALVQVIESPGLAGQDITFSVHGLSGGSLNVSAGGVSGVIVPGSGTQSVTLALPSSASGHITLSLSPANSVVSFKNPKFERGSEATQWIKPNKQQELAICQRYYLKVTGSFFMEAYLAAGGYAYQHAFLPVTMRASPTVSFATTQESSILNRAVTATKQQMDYYMQRQTGSDGRTYLRFIGISFTAEL